MTRSAPRRGVRVVRTYLAAILAPFALAACGGEAPAPDPRAIERIAAQAHPACEQRRFEGSVFTVCPFDTRTDRLELILDGPNGQPLRSLAALERALGPRTSALRFAMNAGMYDEAGRPIGLYVENGVRRHRINTRPGAGNFHLLPNGVFAVDRDGTASVTESRRFGRRRNGATRWATQSGPLLVIDGKLHPRFDADGLSRLVRNGVGVRDPHSAYFVVSEEPVSFGRFARFFRDGLNCSDALYLDGSVSSLWDRPAGRQDAYSNLGPMLVVFGRPATAAPPSKP